MEEYLINATNIHKSFKDHEVLKGVDLSAKKGEIVTLIGSSGCGKSTLLRCLNLLETPEEGELKILNQTIKFDKNNHYLNKHKDILISIRKRIAMVFQQFNLWSHMTCLENITEAPIAVLGLSKAQAVERAEYFLNKVGLSAKKNSYPIQLSGGQQQRVAIARALAMNPEVILFDEPTSSLDPELVMEVLNVMQKLAEDHTTMILVTHELSFAKNISSKILFLDNGLVEQSGTPKEIFENPKSARLQNFLKNHNT